MSIDPKDLSAEERARLGIDETGRPVDPASAERELEAKAELEAARAKVDDLADRHGVPRDVAQGIAAERLEAAVAGEVLDELGKSHALEPITGEALELETAETDRLLAEFERAVDLAARLRDYGEDVRDEVVRRLDRRNERKSTGLLEGFELETNAPTSDEYDVGAVLAQMRPLVESGRIDKSVLDKLVTRPRPKPPPPPEPRVDKREVNKLLKNADAEVAAALERARTRKPNKRSLKVTHLEGGPR